MTRTYWLDPSREPDEIAAEARSRINRYAERMQTSGRAEVMRRMSRLAFSRDADSGLDARAVQIGGEQGELIGTRDNQLGTLNRQVGNMVTSARPSYTARSIATSAESIMHVNVATALCDFMISRRGAEEAAKRAEMFMQLYGKGWGSVIWNERAGKYIGQDETGRKRYTGDIIFAAKRPDEVVEDIDLDVSSTRRRSTSGSWWPVRCRAGSLRSSTPPRRTTSCRRTPQRYWRASARTSAWTARGSVERTATW